MVAKRLIFFFCVACLSASTIQAQNQAMFADPNTNLWMGTYGKFQLTEKLYWDAQFHYRTGGYEETPFVGRLEQIYNRHGLSYRFRPNFLVTVGGVLRLNFTPQPGNPNFEPVRPEPRIWHEYVWSIPYKRVIVYHRIRIEHRWSIGNGVNADWIYRDRWRYKFFMVVPLFKPTLNAKTWFFTPDVEIIMQSGKPVGGSPLEDLRIYPQIGYVQNARYKYTAGLMYTTGQSLADPFQYGQRWVIRANVYVSLDFRKTADKIPEIRIFD